MFTQFGKMLIFTGGLIMLIGIIMAAGDKIPFLGKLPGDFTIKGRSISLYFPLMTGIVISIVLTVILNIFGRR